MSANGGEFWGMQRRQPRGDEHTHSIIGAFFDVYNELGYGLLESVYAQALSYELRCRGHLVEREVWVDVLYKGQPVARQRIDLLPDCSAYETRITAKVI